MQESTKGAGAGVVVAAGLAGLVAGAALVSLLRGGDGPEESVAPVALAAPDVVRELQALNGELAALRGALGRAQSAPDAAGVEPRQLHSDATAGDALAALAAAIEHLSSWLGDTRTTALAAPSASGPSSQALRDKALQLIGQDRQSLREQHLLWTEQQVLDAYGRPTWIEVSEGAERWFWGVEGGPYFSVSLNDRHVISVSSRVQQ
jgi:hypothetical protein